MYKYSLDKSSKKFECPSCRKKRFVKYIDNETKEYLFTNVGRCDREINCGYHFTPKNYFLENPSLNIDQFKGFEAKNLTVVEKIDYHTIDEMKNTLSKYSDNQFVQFLFSKFNKTKVLDTIEKYQIGTAIFSKNETIFWQIDVLNNVRAGKIIQYDNDGRRSKYINWYHSYLIKKNVIKKHDLVQCFFGEHLLKNNSKPIAIVESEKTACIMDIIFNKYTWMATGSLRGLTNKKFNPLKNKKIVLYPDLGIESENGSPFSIWKNKCDELKFLGFDISISKLLEDNSNNIDRENGLDIADYFINNQNNKSPRLISRTNSKALEMYMKNKNIKTLIEVFDLVDSNGKEIDFS